MGWEKRGKNRYYYQKKRQGKRVISTYIGNDELFAEIIEWNRTAEVELRSCQREAMKQEREAHQLAEMELEQASNLIQALTRAALLATGHHTHKGTWRKDHKNGRNSNKSES